MPNITIAEAFRYLLSGFIGFLYLFICDPEWGKIVFDTLGNIGLVGTALAVGTLLYVCYRSLLYNKWVILFQDVIPGKGTYRSYLRQRYGKYNLSRSDAVQLYIVIRDTELCKKNKSALIPAANVHYTYLAGFMAIPFAAISHHYDKPTEWIFYIFIVVFLVSAFLFDRRFEREELSHLKALVDTSAMDKIAEHLFGTDKTSK